MAVDDDGRRDSDRADAMADRIATRHAGFEAASALGGAPVTGRRVWRVLGLDQVRWPPPDPVFALVANVAALIVCWALLQWASGGVRAFGLGVLAHKTVDSIVIAFGACVAARLRARGATIVLAGCAVAAAIEAAMDAIAGAPTLHGFGPHMWLYMSAVMVVLLGALGASRPPGSVPRSAPRSPGASRGGRRDPRSVTPPGGVRA